MPEFSNVLRCDKQALLHKLPYPAGLGPERAYGNLLAAANSHADSNIETIAGDYFFVKSDRKTFKIIFQGHSIYRRGKGLCRHPHRGTENNNSDEHQDYS
jgi:hypothetical protein